MFFPLLANPAQAMASSGPMFFRIGKTGHLSLRKQRVNHDEVLLHCARIGFNP